MEWVRRARSRSSFWRSLGALWQRRLRDRARSALARLTFGSSRVAGQADTRRALDGQAAETRPARCRCSYSVPVVQLGDREAPPFISESRVQRLVRLADQDDGCGGPRDARVLRAAPPAGVLAGEPRPSWPSSTSKSLLSRLEGTHGNRLSFCFDSPAGTPQQPKRAALHSAARRRRGRRRVKHMSNEPRRTSLISTRTSTGISDESPYLWASGGTSRTRRTGRFGLITRMSRVRIPPPLLQKAWKHPRLGRWGLDLGPRRRAVVRLRSV